MSRHELHCRQGVIAAVFPSAIADGETCLEADGLRADNLAALLVHTPCFA